MTSAHHSYLVAGSSRGLLAAGGAPPAGAAPHRAYYHVLHGGCIARRDCRVSYLGCGCAQHRIESPKHWLLLSMRLAQRLASVMRPSLCVVRRGSWHSARMLGSLRSIGNCVEGSVLSIFFAAAFGSGWT